jgi:hypothetical protein
MGARRSCDTFLGHGGVEMRTISASIVYKPGGNRAVMISSGRAHGYAHDPCSEHLCEDLMLEERSETGVDLRTVFGARQ